MTRTVPDGIIVSVITTFTVIHNRKVTKGPRGGEKACVQGGRNKWTTTLHVVSQDVDLACMRQGRRKCLPADYQYTQRPRNASHVPAAAFLQGPPFRRAVVSQSPSCCTPMLPTHLSPATDAATHISVSSEGRTAESRPPPPTTYHLRFSKNAFPLLSGHSRTSRGELAATFGSLDAAASSAAEVARSSPCNTAVCRTSTSADCTRSARARYSRCHLTSGI